MYDLVESILRLFYDIIGYTGAKNSIEEFWGIEVLSVVICAYLLYILVKYIFKFWNLKGGK